MEPIPGNYYTEKWYIIWENELWYKYIQCLDCESETFEAKSYLQGDIDSLFCWCCEKYHKRENEKQQQITDNIQIVVNAFLDSKRK